MNVAQATVGRGQAPENGEVDGKQLRSRVSKLNGREGQSRVETATWILVSRPR